MQDFFSLSYIECATFCGAVFEFRSIQTVTIIVVEWNTSEWWLPYLNEDNIVAKKFNMGNWGSPSLGCPLFREHLLNPSGPWMEPHHLDCIIRAKKPGCCSESSVNWTTFIILCTLWWIGQLRIVILMPIYELDTSARLTLVCFPFAVSRVSEVLVVTVCIYNNISTFPPLIL